MTGRLERRSAVRSLADDCEAALLEQPAGEAPKRRMVVHDQHRLHVPIVTFGLLTCTQGCP